MRPKPLEIAARAGTLVVALLLLPFLMVAGLFAFVVRALWPGQVQTAPQKACQVMTGDGVAPRPADRYARWLGRDAD